MPTPLAVVRIIFGTLCAAIVAPGAERPPNVIVILADDLGYGTLGSYGHPRFKTPNLDRMAAEGVRLTHFNTPTASCAPTRASLMTGRYPFRCGLTANPSPSGPAEHNELALPRSERVLAQLFKEAGYATGMVGKWHLGHKHVDFYPTRRGFDEYLGLLYSNDMRPIQLLDGEKVIEYPVVQATLTRRYTARALDFLTRNATTPFFFYFAHVMPHKPLATTERFYQKSGAGLYGDIMADLDASVGEVLAKVKELGVDDHTLIIFTSDNGPWYGGSSGGLRAMKGGSWEGGYRVPLIARWPGKIPAGVTSDALGVMPDLFATTLSAAGIPLPGDRVIDGRNLLPVLTSGATSPHDVIVGHQGPRLATIRDARWKLHVLPATERRDGTPGERWIDPWGPDGVTILAPYEQYQPSDYPGVRGGDPGKAGSLFDLQTDPAEQRDVSAQHPEVVARLRKHFDDLNASVPPLAPSAPKQK